MEIMQLNNQQALPNFYGSLAKDDANFLAEKQNQIANTTTKFYTEVGKILAEAQERYSNHDKNKGIFEKWLIALGINKTHAHRLIDRYNYLVTNCYDINLLESLPVSLSYEVSKPSADPLLVKKVFEGDIKTHKEYKELEATLKNKTAETEKLKSDLKEKEAHLLSKENMVKSLMNEKAAPVAAVQEVIVKSEVDTKLLDSLNAKIEALSKQAEQSQKQVKELEKTIKSRDKEIDLLMEEKEAMLAAQEELEDDYSNDVQYGNDDDDEEEEYYDQEEISIADFTGLKNKANPEFVKITDFILSIRNLINSKDRILKCLAECNGTEKIELKANLNDLADDLKIFIADVELLIN